MKGFKHKITSESAEHASKKIQVVPDPLFCHPDSTPLVRSRFVTEVKQALQCLGYDFSQFAGHSSRAGLLRQQG